MTPRYRLLPLAALAAATLAATGAARAAASPADASSPVVDTRPAHEFHPLVGVLYTGEINTNSQSLTNPDGSSVTADMGARMEAFAGFEMPVTRGGLRVRLTAGYHRGPATTPAGGERYVSYPLEASLVYAANDRFRLGAGAHYTLHAHFTGAGGNSSDGLYSVPGVFAFAEVEVLPHLWLDGRYVSEYFEPSAGGTSLNTGHWGLGAVAEY